VQGRIDRIDELTETSFAIWDYKVGSGYGYDQLDPFRQGRRVQSVLYVRMIESALRDKLDPSAVVAQFGYFFPSIRARGLRVHWKALELAAGLRVVERLCDAIRDGAFPATNKVEDCKFCDYSSICRDVNRVTTRSEELLARDDLIPLRHFRELRCGQT
jgi:ATP-dependent helicase/nuclease subunit B